MGREATAAVLERVRPVEVPESSYARLAEVEAELAELAGMLNAAHGRVVGLVAAALEEGLWAQPGVHSPAEWLAWQLGWSRANARRLVRLAERAGELPVTVAAVAAGELSLDQAAVVGRHVPASHEASACDLAKLSTVGQLERNLSRYAFPPEPAVPTPEPGVLEERRDVTFGTTAAGRWRLRADLPVDEGALVEAALVARRNRLVDEADTTDERRTVSWADAFVDLAAGGDTTTRTLVVAHLEADPVDTTRPGRVGLHLGSPLPRALARLFTCDTDVQPAWQRRGATFDLGRSTPVVSLKLRRTVEHRDGGCRVPGCHRRGRFLQIHHVRHWEDGGPTDLDNLIALCRRHHRLHHLGYLGITGTATDPDGIRYTNRRGEPIEPSGRPRPPDELPASPGYTHPTGERIQSRWLTIAPQPPPEPDD